MPSYANHHIPMVRNGAAGLRPDNLTDGWGGREKILCMIVFLFFFFFV
jgi:hypothetical protein